MHKQRQEGKDPEYLSSHEEEEVISLCVWRSKGKHMYVYGTSV